MEQGRDPQIRTESKTRLVAQINLCLHSGDYSHALDLLRGTAAEFPNDAELSELEKLAQDGVKRKAEAHRLITESQELFAQQKSAAGIQLLREAYELDENNPLARAILANALVEHAHSIVETDWREAETLAKQALDLNPAHPTAKTIGSLILDQKKASFVEECVSQARKLQSSGNLSAALSRIAKGLAVYPRDPGLLQIHDSIQRDDGAQRRQARRRDLEDLRRMESEIDASADFASQQTLSERIQAVTAKYSTDGEILSVANGLLQRLGLLEVPPQGSIASPDSEGATVIDHAPPPSALEASFAATRPGPPSPVLPSPIPPGNVPTGIVPPSKIPPTIAPPGKVPTTPPEPHLAAPQATTVPAAEPSAPAAKVTSPSSQPKPPTKSHSTTLILVSAATMVLAAATFLIARKHHAPPVAKTPSLAPTVSAPAVSAPAQTAPEPFLPALRLSSDITAGKVTLDDQPPAEFQDGQWSLDQLAAGEHKLKFESPQEKASYTFSAAAGTFPIVTSPIVSTAAMAVVLSGMAGHLRVYSSDAAAKVSLDGQPPLNVPRDGLDFPSVSLGAHQLAVTRGHDKDQYKLDIDAGPAPTLSTFIESGHNLGTLLVVAGQDDARVFLNGKLQGQLTQAGQLRLPNLELKDYVVQVSKGGFQDPPQQKIRIRKGEQARLIFHLQLFNLQPQPRLASLTIQGGAPGTTVLVDQTLVGTILPDGTLSVSSINPGDHTVELRNERFPPRQFKKHFDAGGTISLAAAESLPAAGAALETASGELKITFAPADAKVAIVRGELLKMVSSGVPLNLAAGTYTLTARTAERFTRSSTLEVTAGQSKSLDLSLAPSGMSKWDDPGAWKHETDSFIRKGGDFVLYGVVPASGTFIFSAMLTKGHLLQWVLNYSDPKNYVLFQMDDNAFYRTVIRNGEKTDEIKVADKGDKKSFRTLGIRVSPTELVHQIKHGDSWTILDHWKQPGANLSLGKFGFYIPGNDQVALSSFAHYGDLNTR